MANQVGRESGWGSRGKRTRSAPRRSPHSSAGPPAAMVLAVCLSLSASAGYRAGDEAPALLPLAPSGTQLAVGRLLASDPTGTSEPSWLGTSKRSTLLAVYRAARGRARSGLQPAPGFEARPGATTAEAVEWTAWGEASRDGSCEHQSAAVIDGPSTDTLADAGWTGESEPAATCEHASAEPALDDEFIGPPAPPETIVEDAFVDAEDLPALKDFAPAEDAAYRDAPTCGAALAAIEDEGAGSCDVAATAAPFLGDRQVVGSCHGPACGDPGFGFDPLAESRFNAASPLQRAPAGSTGLADVGGVAGLTNPAGADHGSAFERFLSERRTLDTPPATRAIVHRIRPGETLSEVLDSAGIMPNEVSEWITAARKVYDLNRIYVGQALSLAIDTSVSRLERLSLDIDRRNRVVVLRSENGLLASRESIPYETSLRVVTGRIESSLYMAAVKQGIPERVVSSMAEILGWELDFARDLRPDAGFRVVYEELTRAGDTESTPGRVLAVEVMNQGKRHEGIYFGSPDGRHGAYYTREGDGLGRQFLRYPVEFTRISSKFSSRRFHPVLKRSKPHYGVDFAAPTGTPVQALAAGQVRMAGWHGGNGNFIKIRHDEIYESGYAHLSRIDPSIKPGTRVKKGQVIGLVGSTGLATGPHLHLALYRKGRYIDPLTSDLPHARPLAERERVVFAATVKAIDHAYAQAEGGSARVAAIPLEHKFD